MDNNIIEFPVEEVKDKVQAERNELVAANKASKNRWKSAVALGAIVLSMFLINGSDISTGPAQNYAGETRAADGRVIASVDSTFRDTAWEHRLAKYLSKRSPRGVASRGQSTIEKIDELAANYSMYSIQSAENNTVLSIQLPAGVIVEAMSYDGDAPEAEELAYLGKEFDQEKMIKFIERYKSILVSGVTDLEAKNKTLVFSTSKDAQGLDVYSAQLVSPSKNVELTVQFKLANNKLANYTGIPVDLASIQ